jgi:YggT family protein
MEPEERIVREEPAAVGPEQTEVVSRFSPARRAYETIYVIFAIIVGAIFIRVLLKVLGANTAVVFTQFMYGVTDPLLAPFRGVLPTFGSGRMILETSSLFAILIYGLIGIALARLVAIMFMRDVTVAHGSRSGRVKPNTD